MLRCDELVNLRAVVEGGNLDSVGGCFVFERPPVPLCIPDALITEKILPAISRVALQTTDAELRAEAKAAYDRITAPKRAPDARLVQLTEATSFEAARPLLDQLRWSARSLPLGDFEAALRDPSIDPPSLKVWRAVAALRADHPARIELAARLANLQPAAGPRSQAYFLAVGSIATASSHPVDERLRQKLIAALDVNSDDAQVARLALGRSAARPASGAIQYPPPSRPELDARRLLRERFDDVDPARRRATWLAASLLDAGRSKAGEKIDFELRDELRARFDHAGEALDVSASALALTWFGDPDAREQIHDRFVAENCPARGYLALSLALLDSYASVEPMQSWSLTTTSHTERLDAALALAIIGDKLDVLHWVESLLGPEPQSIAHLARGFAAIGDVRAVDPLLTAIANEDFDTPERIALLRALATVCDPNATDRRLSNYFTGR